MDAHYYKIVDGLSVPTVFVEENFRSALKYVPRDGDLFVVTYPKCGTTWMQHIVCSILSRGQPPTTVSDIRIMAPFIDLNGAGRAESPRRSGPVLTHLPFHLLRPSKRAKYIYVARNPYDCAVSSYYFAKGFIPTTVEDVSFDRFLSMFIAGKVPYGDYFEHVLPWYRARDEDNVLFVTYEQLKEDTAGQVLRIADFMGSYHGVMLRDDAEMLNKVVHSCSVRSMRMVHSDVPQERIRRLFSASCNETAPSDEECKVSPVQSMHQGSGFVRKGVVGDWKNHFSAEHVARTKAWIADKCKDSDVMTLWENVGLP